MQFLLGHPVVIHVLYLGNVPVQPSPQPSVTVTASAPAPSTSTTVVRTQSSTSSPARPLTNWAEDFDVPWAEMPAELMRALQGNTRPEPKHHRAMVRLITRDVMKITAKPGRDSLRRIAARVVEKWPQSFRDQIGTGSHSLFLQLENCVDNNNRGSSPACKTSKRASASADVEEVVAPPKKEEGLLWLRECPAQVASRWRDRGIGGGETSTYGADRR